MLIDHREALISDPILTVLADGVGTQRLQQGVYKIGHFGGSHWLPSFEQWPDLEDNIPSYGVCDSPEQLLEKYPWLQETDRKFLISVTQLLKKDMDPRGGWRWHKWGPYIGEQDPKEEYLYEEPDIEEIWVFHIYEKKE